MRVYRALGLQLRMPGKRSRIRGSDAYTSTSSYLDATSVTRHKTPALIRDNENAWTEVDAEASLARFPASRCSGMLTPSRSALRRASRSRSRPDIPASAVRFCLYTHVTFGPYSRHPPRRHEVTCADRWAFAGVGGPEGRGSLARAGESGLSSRQNWQRHRR